MRLAVEPKFTGPPECPTFNSVVQLGLRPRVDAAASHFIHQP